MKDSESCSRGNVFIVVFRNGGWRGGGVEGVLEKQPKSYMATHVSRKSPALT